MSKKEKTRRITINKVYTRTGDGGETRLVGGQIRNKSDIRVDAYGTVDELNSVIGGCIDVLERSPIEGKPDLITTLIDVQNRLFDLGTITATLPENIQPGMPRVTTDNIHDLESSIDHYNRDLPVLHSFVLPGGSEASVWFHLARTVCRRTERICVRLSGSESLDPLVIQYLNRLSDALFVWSRWVNTQLGVNERMWEPT